MQNVKHIYGSQGKTWEGRVRAIGDECALFWKNFLVTFWCGSICLLRDRKFNALLVGNLIPKQQLGDIYTWQPFYYSVEAINQEIALIDCQHWEFHYLVATKNRNIVGPQRGWAPYHRLPMVLWLMLDFSRLLARGYLHISQTQMPIVTASLSNLESTWYLSHYFQQTYYGASSVLWRTFTAVWKHVHVKNRWRLWR